MWQNWLCISSELTVYPCCYSSGLCGSQSLYGKGCNVISRWKDFFFQRMNAQTSQQHIHLSMTASARGRTGSALFFVPEVRGKWISPFPSFTPRWQPQWHSLVAASQSHHSHFSPAEPSASGPKVLKQRFIALLSVSRYTALPLPF